MTGELTHFTIDGVTIIRLESDLLRVDVAPSIGGRVVNLVTKSSGYDFLWRNQKVSLRPLPTGAEYDSNFYGGIDELLPNDIPECINGVDCPDHGELWTTALTWRGDGNRMMLEGRLAHCGLTYEREMSLRAWILNTEFPIAPPGREIFCGNCTPLWPFNRATLSIVPPEKLKLWTLPGLGIRTLLLSIGRCSKDCR
jgi:hypothetical protein